MAHIALSVVVLTKNEERRIRACLESLQGWADEVIVVDDESTDTTLDIVEEFPCRLFRRKMLNEGGQRNWAAGQASHDWILMLDADERVTPALRQEIDAVLTRTTCAAFAVPYKNYIGSTWIRHSGWYPASKERLFQKGKFRYEEVEVHPQIFIEGAVGVLTEHITHQAYTDFEHFLTKLNRQTTLEAQKWLRTGVSMPAGRIVRRSIDRFFRSFFAKKGFKDGFMGFMIAYFSSMYQIMSYAKYWEYKERERRKTFTES